MEHICDALLAQDAELRRQYHHLAGNDARPSELRALEKAISDNVAAISAAICEGAQPCECGGALTGRQKTPAHEHKGAEVSAVYEIGCGACGKRSRGPSPARTVERWNAGEYVVEKGA